MTASSQPLVMSGNAESRHATRRHGLDQAVAQVRRHALEWARLPVDRKAALVRLVMEGVRAVAPDWVEAACEAKGIDPRSARSGEEWLGGPVTTMRNLRLVAESLDEIARYGRPRLGEGARVRIDGRLEIKVFPTSRIEQIVFNGFEGWVLMQKGIDEWEARERQASFYHQRAPKGVVAAILGAGNVASIPAMDVISKMFTEGQVCVLKMNPVNEWLGPLLEAAFKPLVGSGYLRIVYGGAQEGSALVNHPGVDEVHITGSDRTHDLIVWGPPGPQREKRKRAGKPLLRKRITSELGNVSPVVIVPGKYSSRQLWFQAQSIASQLTNNASFNCNAAKVLVTSKDWLQRDAFLAMLRRALGTIPPRKAYYPGAFDRYASLLSGRSRVERFGEPADGELPWALVTGLDPSDAAERLFLTEPFCGILAETAIPGREPPRFLAAAGEFLDCKLWGTLNACIIMPHRESRDAHTSAAVDRLLVEMRYGAVAINHWPALVYGFVSPPWGGHPSATLADVQSGMGWVHNTFMLEGIDKSRIRGPLSLFPKPAWFHDNRQAHRIGQRLLALEYNPSWSKVAPLALTALAG